jgi:hypothetical protein
MGYKRLGWSEHKWFWHRNNSKRKRMDRLFAKIDAEQLFISGEGIPLERSINRLDKTQSQNSNKKREVIQK